MIFYENFSTLDNIDVYHTRETGVNPSKWK